MKATVNGNKVTIEAELTPGVPSSTGKSLLVFTTGGFVPIEGTGFKVAINIIKSRK